MFIVNSYLLAVVFCFITMLCWGSWANTQKLAAKSWRYELFYWDYVIGMFLFSVLLAFTMGSHGVQGRPFIEDLAQSDGKALWNIILGGVIFNASNILLSASTSIAGLAVAFPLGVGISLVLGTVVNYIGAPKGDPVLLFIGVAFIVVAIVCNGIASGKMSSSKKEGASKGIVLAAIAGIVMAFFYRFVAASMDLDNFASPAAGKVTPYTAIVVFSAGVLLSNFIFNTIVMKKPFVGDPVEVKAYFKGNFKTHMVGVLGGAIWCLGTAFSYIASGKAGAAISYALGQGAPMVAAIWGVFIWKEFKGARKSVYALITVMFCFFIAGLAFIISSAETDESKAPAAEVTMSKEVLMDKIQGAWAGQIIGCTYGGPTEFRYATIINDNVDIPWDEHIIKRNYDNYAGLYDDVYMDLTFVDVFERCGLDAPVDSFATAFAYAGYPLWHANQQARYNIVNGIMPPASGWWENNPHADDIDFQIEADYAGIMAPGMPQAASEYCNGIGHIMNSGDGYYGGVYVAAMYSLAFVSDDINYIVEEALKEIPAESRFYKCMADVIKWHKQYPDDWNITWLFTNRDYNFDIGCPEGVLTAYDIDAVLNCAYIVIGLLYGEKDFYRTIDISCRCGADSDCNPASAGGILATVLGYSGISDYWKTPLVEVADQNFKYTDISFNKASCLSFKHALQVIEQNGGLISEDEVTIKTQAPEAVPFEECFTGHWPVETQFQRRSLGLVKDITFDGNGVVVRYDFVKSSSFNKSDYVAEVEVYLDGVLDKTVYLPASGRMMSPEFYYKYNLPVGKHVLTFKWVNKPVDLDIRISRTVVYSDKPRKTQHTT